MSEAPSPPAAKGLPAPSNDNGSQRKPLKAIVLVPVDLPIVRSEVEVIAALLDASLFAANDNEEPGQ